MKREKIKPVFLCEKCDMQFSCKRNLKRHSTTKHTEGPRARPYECEICRFAFTRKDILQKHILRKHVKREKQEFVCAECSKIFDSKVSIKQHFKISHTPRTKDALGCPHCEKRFTTYRTLKRHVVDIHFRNGRLQCAYCLEKFGRKDNLARHIRIKHLQDNNSFGEYQCTQCEAKFPQKHLLRDHTRYRHYISKEGERKAKANNLRCLECKQNFSWKRALNYHYEQDHGVTLSFKNLHFDAFEKFEEWRKSMQAQTVTQFVQRNGWKTEDFEIKQYACHRSGTYCGKHETRIRKLKKTGYKKLGGHCPAEIFLKFARADGQCIVTFQQTHVGHATNDKTELDHVFLNQEEKQRIAAMIEDGETMNEILTKQRSINPSEEDNSRLSILSRKDLHNVVSRLTIKSRRSKASIDDLDGLVTQNSNSILFVKDQSQEDTIFHTLDKDDFVMVLMNRSQEEYIRRYGRKIIAFDGIEETSPFDFHLHAMLVADVDCEAVPVAFMVSNRSDQDVADIFVKSVRDHVGIVETKVVLTDMQNMYYNSWVCMMKEPDHHFYSSWHVCESWNKMLRQITSRKKKNDLREKLYNLAHELDEIVFEEKLESFLTMEDDHEFMKFFRSNFAKNAQFWAHCYRNIAGLNTNMHFDLFLKTFRRGVTKGKRKNLHECLIYVLEYLVVDEQNEGITQIGTMVLKRMSALRRRHKSTEQLFQQKMLIVIETINDETWQVGFLHESEDVVQEMYLVTKIEPKECGLYENSPCRLPCVSCNVCFHEYRCSCQDSVIFNNMCEHIHALGMYLQNLNSADEDCAIDDLNSISEDITVDELDNDIVDTGYDEFEENTIVLDVDMVRAEEMEKINDEMDAIDELEVERIALEEAFEEVEVTDERETIIVKPSKVGMVDELRQRLLQRVENVLLLAETTDQLDEIRANYIDPILLSIKNENTD